MSFFEKRTVEYYIREISELMVPVTVIINDTIELPNCLLFYKTANSRELLVQTRPGKYPKTGEVCYHLRLLKGIIHIQEQNCWYKKNRFQICIFKD